MQIQGIIFDMDGTLTMPLLDFRPLRREFAVPTGADLIEALNRLPEPERSRGWAKVDELERYALEHNQLQPGVAEALEQFSAAGLKLALLTRNKPASLAWLHSQLPIHFDPILTRDFPAVKPSPLPALHILQQWNLPPEACLLVGDNIDDLTCARNAAIPGVFFRNHLNRRCEEIADYIVGSYAELAELVFKANRAAAD